MRIIKRIIKNIFYIYVKIFNLILNIFDKFLEPKSSKELKEYLIIFTHEYYQGNLKFVYEELTNRKTFNGKPFKAYWVVRNPAAFKKFIKLGVKTLWFYDVRNIPKFLKTNIWLNSHGKGGIPIKKKKNSLWVQLWHGLTFKGYAGNEETKRGFNEFDLHPVSSEWWKDYYIKGIGVEGEKVVVTGYPRIDKLLMPYYEREKILKEIGFDPEKKTILYAPTWEQETEIIKPLFPWGNDVNFLKKLDLFLEKNNLQLIIRFHPNHKSFSKETEEIIKKTDRITQNSLKTDWDTEKYLYVSDILITDWSSIANDFLVLNRPVIFLEIPILFKYGFALRPEERAGIIVKAENEFFEAILKSLKNPDEYERKRKEIVSKIHFKTDGKASERVIKAMEKYAK